MPNHTPNYNLAQPLVNSAVDQDLWGGELNNNMSIIDTTLKSLQDQISALSSGQLPIGSIYTNKTNSSNPSVILGYGTWVAITDKFIVARGSTYTATGGAANVTLVQNNLPATLTGLTTLSNDVSNPSTNGIAGANPGSGGNPRTLTFNISNPGGGQSFSIIPTYQAAYMWERTA